MTRIQRRSLKKAFSPALTIAALGALVAACTPAAPSEEGGATSSDAMMQSSSAMMIDNEASEDSAMMMEEGAYNDGTYSSDGNYRSPGGDESIGVTLTLEDGVIIEAAVTPHADRPKSVMMQGQFVAGFREQVIGRSIDEVSLGVVNGSSLTPLGFMDAVAKIKAEATAS